ncbi:MAG: hypothetical protein U5K56_17015 [Halioglobus sp.]|nr:hypothetical protein [Halioglobus sp.]
MGFTPFHFSWIEDRITETYEMIYAHSDLLAYHFDEGVPWPEAFDEKAIPPKCTEEELSTAKGRCRRKARSMSPPHRSILNAVALADYWEKKEQLKRPGSWEKRKTG